MNDPNTQWVEAKRLAGKLACRRDVDRSAPWAGSVWACDAADVAVDLTNYWNLLISEWERRVGNCVRVLCSASFSLYYTCVDTVTCELSSSITFKEKIYIYLNECSVHKYFLNTAVNYCTFLLMLLFPCFDIMNELWTQYPVENVEKLSDIALRGYAN